MRWLGAVLGLLIGAAMGPALAGDKEAARLNGEANEKYRENQYDEAMATYSKALSEAPDSPVVHYNMGNALYRLGRTEEAADEYGTATAGVAARSELGQAARFNHGNALFAGGDYKGAANEFRQVLLAAPEDEAAKRNLEMSLARLQKQEEQEQQQQQQEQQDGDEEQQEQEQQQQQQGDEDPPPGDEQEQQPQAEPPADDPGEPEEGGSPPASNPSEELGKEEARRLLDALSEDEKTDLKESMQRFPQKNRRPEHDW